MSLLITVWAFDTVSGELREYNRETPNDNPGLHHADVRTMLEDITGQFSREQPFKREGDA